MYSKKISMLRFMTPYLLVYAVLTAAAGVGYGAGSLSVAATYGVACIALLVAGAGYARWDERQHPHHH